MSAQLVSAVFCGLLCLSVALQWLLSHRQTRAVAAHLHCVPAEFADAVSLEQHQTAGRYALAKQRLARIDIFFQAAWLIILTYGGGLNVLDGLSRAWFSHPLAQGVALIGLFAAANWLVSLPFSWYRAFRLEASFGFNQMSRRTFFMDQIKGVLLGVLIGAPLAAAALHLMGAMGQYWWGYVWALWVAFSLVLMWAFPRWIAPLFNEFKPLEDSALHARIEALLQRTGFRSSGIFVMDGSKRSGHGNAYFTGLGKNKRIVFFDTLLNDMQPNEMEAVLAHELGHFAHRHIIKQMLLTFALAGVVLAILGRLAKEPGFYHGLGVNAPSYAMALILFLLVLPVATFIFSPLGGFLSRRNEFEADRFAAAHSSAHELSEALIKLYRNNAASLVSDKWHARFYDSHPGASERLAALKALEAA